MTPFNLLRLDGIPIMRQLQLEEALLRADARNWCLINKGSPPAIVMGISGKRTELIDEHALMSSPVPIIRRFSGGGTVVVDEHTLFITWIANAGEAGVPCCPQKMLRWTSDLYKPAFGEADFRLRENDYAIGERKCGGNAQYLCKGRWLHHTSFLWDYCPRRMLLLRMPPKTPAYRQGRGHEEFICRLSEHCGDYSAFEERLLTHLSTHIHLAPTSLEIAEAALQKPHRRATVLL